MNDSLAQRMVYRAIEDFLIDNYYPIQQVIKITVNSTTNPGTTNIITKMPGKWLSKIININDATPQEFIDSLYNQGYLSEKIIIN